MQRLALFDIDGTLVTGASTERRFYRHLLRTGAQGPRQVAAALWFLLSGWPRFGRQVFKKNKAYLYQLPVARVTALADAWVPRALAGAWHVAAVRRLHQHLADGDRVVLLSGTPDFLAAAIARELGVNRSIGSACERRGGRFGRRAPARHPFGAEKLALARELCAQQGVAAADVVAYGDSRHDLDLLRWVGRAVAVRPDAGLLAEAAARGWEVLGQRHGVGGAAGLPSTLRG